MTKNEVMELLNTIKNDDVIISTWKKNNRDIIEVLIDDFEGFDDDWNEIERDYDEKAVEEVIDKIMLSANLRGFNSNLYDEYEFDDFTVLVGYTSFDI